MLKFLGSLGFLIIVIIDIWEIIKRASDGPGTGLLR